jgi:hypothetical protein
VFQGHDVVVIQQWVDPFGRRMVRIQTTGPGPEQAIGLLDGSSMPPSKCGRPGWRRCLMTA